MPELNLGDWKDGAINNPWAALNVQAVMYHPNDPVLREELLAYWLVQGFLAHVGSDSEKQAVLLARCFTRIGGLHTGLRTLLYAPSFDEVMNRAKSATRHGEWAGQILLLIAQMEYDRKREGHGKVGSFNKAMHILLYGQAKYGPRKKRGEHSKRNPHPYNSRGIGQAWTDFKSVAHLWAADRLMRRMSDPRVPAEAFFEASLVDSIPLPIPTYPDEPWVDFPSLPIYPAEPTKDLPSFLALAEFFRCFGITHIPRPQRTPTLSPKDMWTVPIGFPLPPISLELEPPSLSVWEKAALGEYQAPKRI